MSTKSINAYTEYRRDQKTLPPPAEGGELAKLESQWRREAHKASRAFARSRELESKIEALRAAR